jgi:hypothetical protein
VSDCRSPEQFDQRLILRAKGRTLPEKLLHDPNEALVLRVDRDDLLVEELDQGRVRRVAIAHPHHDHFLEGDLATRDAVNGPLETLPGALPVVVVGDCRKPFGKGHEEPLKGLFPENTAQGFFELLHHRPAKLVEIEADDVVKDLVNQAHRVDVPGLHRPLGMDRRAPHGVDLHRKIAGAAGVGDEYVTSQREAVVVKSVRFPGAPSDMKLPAGSRNGEREAYKGGDVLVVHGVPPSGGTDR